MNNLKKFRKPHTKLKFSGSVINIIDKKIRRISVMEACEYGKLSKSEIESARRIIRQSTEKKGKLYIRIVPYLQQTKRPAEVRMGKGKSGKIVNWVSPVKYGKRLFELHGLHLTRAELALKKAAYKLSVKTIVYSLKI